MAKVTIDNKEYDLDTLSSQCKAQLASIQFVEQELARLQAQAAALQTAKAAYLQALEVSLHIFDRGDNNSLKILKNPDQLKSPPQIELDILVEYYQKGQHSLAQNLATTLTQQYPNHPFGWKVLGAVFKQTGRLQDSVIANQKVLEISPNDEEAQSNLGVTLKELGRLLEAETSYKRAIAIKPDYAEAHYNLGITLQELGRLQEAEISYKTVITIKPDYFEAHHNLGVTLQLLGKLEEAQTSYKKAIAFKPDFAIAHSNLGNTLQELGRLEDAEASYKKAIAIRSDLEEAHSNLGRMLKELGRLEEAEVSYKKAIAINPDYAEAYSNLGNTLQELGRLEEAETSYKKAIAIKPDYALAHSNLGITLQELGKLDEALTSYKRAITIKPDFAQAHSNLGNTLRELGRLEDAETSCKKAIVIKPDLAEAYNNLGNTLKELGRLEDAETSYKKAIAIKPDLAQAHNNLGITLQELGRLESAETSYKKAIVIKPNYAEAYFNLGSSLKELGRVAEAEASYARAVSLKPDYIKARNEMLTCLYLMDKKSLLFDQLDLLIKQDKTDSVIGSITYRAALRYGVQKQNIFCNEPLEYALLVDLKSRYNFEETFVRNVKSILNDNKRSNKRQALLSKGFQTSGNLFNIDTNLTCQIQKAIRLEIERYRINFQSSEEGFIRKWPSDYGLIGWLISMKSGGELSPHIHENGWLSGSIYINVPPNSKNDSGKLVVALGKDSDATDSRQNSKKVIDVVTGSMALFPASLMHHTIPFESDEERIVLAFDVVPKSN